MSVVCRFALGILIVLMLACPGEPRSIASCERMADSSSFPGVAISVPEQPCSWSAATLSQGVVLRYQFTVDRDIPGLTPIPQDLGGCQAPRFPGLTVFRVIRGEGGTFCPECDLGPCPARSAEAPVTLARGTYSDSIIWKGMSYFGPSDGNSSLGPQRMPPGEYLLTVSLAGRRIMSDSSQRSPRQARQPNDSVYTVRTSFRLAVTK